ncbi:uncharacterized protein LOC111397817 [Olea europaea var. sylvestris]|uniref:uncharacterized protein LOC111397817 n=1 Tax=Olea europaea var. sylvestris TaxID=158386 RepID=UPI000C1CCE52|nr:uncharacterized protein LOC111397817 [Olea europaea var. sylvestris]
MQVIELEHKNHGRLAPVEGLGDVKIVPRRKVTIGRGLNVAVMSELLSYLSCNINVFAWNVEDMPGIDLEVTLHRLNFVREVQYLEWLANVVLVKKANGKWRVCIDFTDLNKACPKDSYPLPRIDNLVDSTLGHMLYNFLDAFSGYHQIFMAEEDQEKTSFMVDSTIYCYRVMPFGLKNVGATYQRLVNKIFAKLIGKTVKAYVDDMVVKNKQLNSHVSNLEEVFATLSRYNMKLNPTKCAFGVASGKFLGFMITQRGIEANPDKIQALISMEAPKCKRDIQKLTGRVAVLNRFVSLTADRVQATTCNQGPNFGRLHSRTYSGSSETPAKGSNSTLEIWEIFVDGASNSLGSGASIIITSLDKTTEIQCAFKFEFEATNNEAEYEAVVIALELAKNLECELVKVFSDSQLVVARAENTKADALSRLVFMGVDGLDRTVHVKMVAEPSIAQKPSVMDIDHEPSWMDLIVDYISNGNIPADP